MKLKVGDLVVFKKYDDMTENERLGIRRCIFPEFGKVSEIHNKAKNFYIEGELFSFSTGSIDYIISSSNTDDIHAGDEVLIKTTVGESIRDYVWASCSWISKDDVVGVLKRKEEHFIVQEDCYGMYIGKALDLVSNKEAAQVYVSSDAAYQEANDMQLNAYRVIPYDN